MKRTLLALLLFCNIGLFSAEIPKRPKLILGIVVDQFRYDYLTRFRKDFNSGLARLLEHGAVFTDAHHIAAPTVTAIGHSTFMSGATPSVSGIAGNEWYDRRTKTTVTSVLDLETKVLGGVPGAPGSSPRRLLVSTLGDQLKMATPGSKVIGISIKDRSAILPVGHMADAAYWYDPDSNNWVTSDYYMKELPAWVKQLNKERPSQRYFASSWLPFDQPNGKPYCTMVNGTNVPYCNSLEATPWGNDMIEEMAERAIVNEKLGQHEDTDMLTVSFSSNDYVGHALGPDSPEVRDVSIRTDRLLGKFLDFIDSKAGEGNTILVMTADHGVAPLPEVNQERKMPGGRLSAVVMAREVDEALAAKYGPGRWVESNAVSYLYLNHQLIQAKKLKLGEVEDVVADVMMTMPHAFRVYTGEHIQRGEVTDDDITHIVRNGYFPQRSADVLFIADPYYLFEGSGTSHGTPYNYDTHVPIIFMGPGIKPASYARRIAVNDIAPTLANMLGLEMPSGSVGRVLSELQH